MAGPNWFTANLGTTNPFQQNTTPFQRIPSIQGPQAGYGTGNTLFQSQPFFTGNNMMQMQMQNTINEIVRQTVPRVLASCGIQTSTMGFQSPYGYQSQYGFQTPIGQQFQSTPWTTQTSLFNQSPISGDWQTQIILQEVVRQATNQALQSITQQNPTLMGQSAQTPYGTNWQQQQQQQQNLWNLVGQICQAVTTSLVECLTQSNLGQGTPYSTITNQYLGQQPYFQQQQQPFGQQSPLSMGNTQPQFGVTTGIPAGAGAF
jgi:hypothetical protein